MKSVRTVVCHQKPLVAESIAVALSLHRHIEIVGAVVSIAGGEQLAEAADAIVIDAGFSGATHVCERLRIRGLHVVMVCDAPTNARPPFVSTSESVGTLAQLLRRSSGMDDVELSVEQQLSKREHEILTLVARGLAAKQVARVLHISHRTVELHKQHILRKLDVPNQAAAVSVFISASPSPVNRVGVLSTAEAEARGYT